MLRLVQQGKLSLDDSISQHLPDVPEDCRLITVRHLLQHTSGIPGTNSAGGGDDIRKVLPLFLRGGPRHPPGTHWEYWNQGYALLSEIIANASGKDYTTYCKQELFEPAGLLATRFTGDAAPEGATVVDRPLRPRKAALGARRIHTAITAFSIAAWAALSRMLGIFGAGIERCAATRRAG